jgi:hypothetical protein
MSQNIRVLYREPSFLRDAAGMRAGMTMMCNQKVLCAPTITTGIRSTNHVLLFGKPVPSTVIDENVESEYLKHRSDFF